MNGSAADRRRGRRYQVELNGELRSSERTVSVRIIELSASGALLVLAEPPSDGSVVDLWIQDFRAIRMQVVHSSGNYCGLTLVNPAMDRNDLLDWLRQDTPEASAKQPPI